MKFLIPLLFLLSLPLVGQTTLDITPGVNNVPITGVTYNVGGSTVVQRTAASGVTNNQDSEVFVSGVQIGSGSSAQNLNVFNFEGAQVRNINFGPSSSGVAVFDNGAVTNTNNLADFENAVIGITQDADLMNFLYYDAASNLPGASTADFDLIFRYSFQPTDYILVSERNGNTFFELTPLGADGEVIAGANTLRFGGAGGAAFAVYDWNSGYATSSYVSSQPQVFSVASAGKFFEGTAVTGEIYGFRIDNNGDADVKFFGLSDDTFTNNPENPLFIPEPSTFFLSLIGMLSLVLRRRR